MQHWVVVRTRWLDSQKGGRTAGGASVPLPRDLPPSDAVEFRLDVPTNGVGSGPALLEVSLVQDERDFAADEAPPLRLPVEVREASR